MHIICAHTIILMLLQALFLILIFIFLNREIDFYGYKEPSKEC